MPSRVVERDSNKNLEIDKGIRNCWKWEWLERFVDGNPVRQNIRKIDSRGLARCEVCNKKEINYAGRGWKSLEQHLKKKLHIDNLKIKRTYYSLSVMYHCIPFILYFLQGGVFF
jgi:hypothetical protein